jgi:hypothetical protein
VLLYTLYSSNTDSLRHYPLPAVSALCDIPALFPGSSFQDAAPQFFTIFLSFVLIASALNRRPFLPWFDF